MASGTRLALSELLKDGDMKSWFKWFEFCAAANEWNDEKKLLRLPTLLRGWAWAIFNTLYREQTQAYTGLKVTLDRLSPDMDKDKLNGWDKLSNRWLGDWESVD